MSQTDVYLGMEAVLTPGERQEFLDRFTQSNPHFRGAHVADVLEVLDNGDCHLDIREPMFEERQDEVSNDRALFVVAALTAVYLGTPDWPAVKKLMERFHAGPKGRE